MISANARIYVGTKTVDFRGSFDAPAGVVSERLGQNPRSGAFFVFFNRSFDRVKVLFFDLTVDCIFYKRLDESTFRGIVDLDPSKERSRSKPSSFAIFSPGYRSLAVGRKTSTKPNEISLLAVQDALVSSPQDDREAATSSSDDVSKQIGELKNAVGRATSRIQKLETELDAARAQVAWFHQQIFGQKSDRVRAEDLQAAWLAYLEEQRGESARSPKPDSIIDGSCQRPASARLPPRAPELPPVQSDSPAVTSDAPKPPPTPPKRSGHGRKRVSPTLRERRS